MSIRNCPDYHHHPYLSEAEIVGANIATAAMMRLVRHVVRCEIGKNSRRTGKGREIACQTLKDLLELLDEINVVWR